jgi:RNA 3'-terminal phosphate cyclase
VKSEASVKKKDFEKEIKKILKASLPEQQIEVVSQIQIVAQSKSSKYGIGCLVLGDGVVWDCGKVGEEVAEEEILAKLQTYAEKKVCLDDHHQDQLILLAALAAGRSKLHIGD